MTTLRHTTLSIGVLMSHLLGPGDQLRSFDVAAAEPLRPTESFELPQTRTIPGLIVDGTQVWAQTDFNGAYQLRKISPQGKVIETVDVPAAAILMGGLAYGDGSFFFLDYHAVRNNSTPRRNGRIWRRVDAATLEPFVELPRDQEYTFGVTFHRGALYYATFTGEPLSSVYKIIDGKAVLQAETGKQVRGLTSDGDAVWCSFTNAIMRLDDECRPVETFQLTFDPKAIAWVGRDLWVSEQNSNRLHRIADIPAATLQGTWVVRSVEQAAKSVKSAGPATGDKLVLRDQDYRFSGSTRGEGKLRTSTAKQPATIDLLSSQRNQSLFGIYRLDGDRLTICLTGGTRPTKFEAAGKAVIIEFDRQP